MLDNLLKFQKIIENGNITKAASQLHITQPALSISINNLEKMFDVKLILRNKNGIQPTNIGKTVYKYSKKITLELDNLHKIVEEYKNQSQQIKIGMIDNIANLVLPKFYSFIKQNSEINFKIDVDNTNALIKNIMEHKLDIAIITKPTFKLEKSIEQQKFLEENMYIVGSPKITKNITKIKELNKQKFISYSENSNTHKKIIQTLKINNITPSFIAFSSEPRLMLDMVKADLGLSILPENIIREDILNKKIKKIEFSNILFKREFYIIYLKERYMTKNKKELITLLKDFV